ncbi:unnamed protein product [Angiostrongylus costaricensis]|uniref:Neur_chan_memb domain-containing protein n=1 Tax=Angiostrongylus costaricensis TaxID=334426 RepID=A0A0R3PHH1_ANGCS|nr:unnamed protein product [Angiostrongylus costaricensis]
MHSVTSKRCLMKLNAWRIPQGLINFILYLSFIITITFSDAYAKNEMNATWFTIGPIRYNPEIGLLEYHITSLEHSYCNGVFHYTITSNSSSIGDFSCLIGIVNLKRAIGYHLVQSYIPTALILIVALSWVSFWIDRRAVPARVSLSFTTLLTLSTQGNGIRYALPPVSYAKAIDYFYVVCMLFIFGVLQELAMVNSYMRRANKYNHMAEKLQNGYAHKYALAATDYETDYEEGSLSEKCYKRINKNSTSLMCKVLLYSRKALAIDKTAQLFIACHIRAVKPSM